MGIKLFLKPLNRANLQGRSILSLLLPEQWPASANNDQYLRDHPGGYPVADSVAVTVTVIH
jgi:hypothetical protein